MGLMRSMGLHVPAWACMGLMGLMGLHGAGNEAGAFRFAPCVALAAGVPAGVRRARDTHAKWPKHMQRFAVA